MGCTNLQKRDIAVCSLCGQVCRYLHFRLVFRVYFFSTTRNFVNLQISLQEEPDTYEDILAFHLLYPYGHEYLSKEWVTLLRVASFEKIFEEELVKCGKTAWVDYSDELKEKFVYLSR